MKQEYRGFYIKEEPTCTWIAGTYNNTRLPPKTFHENPESCKGYIDCYLDDPSQFYPM